ncbi:ABSCISIC ACID-INSENSITIVE 5 protein 2 [Spatholobus suberectus]|nr:ABSCISIC ACID-INSENSITIVE 5 protein 2 [Spatholobus suberectus]
MGTNRDRKAQERQPTLGEMTLEDFLVTAGVVAESFPTKGGAMSGLDSNGASSQHGHWMHNQLPSVQQQNVMGGYVAGHAIQQPFQVAVNLVLDAAYSDVPPSLMGALSDTQTPGQKRVASGDVVEKTVERRQKRMIKKGICCSVAGKKTGIHTRTGD